MPGRERSLYPEAVTHFPKDIDGLESKSGLWRIKDGKIIPSVNQRHSRRIIVKSSAVVVAIMLLLEEQAGAESVHKRQRCLCIIREVSRM